MNASQIKENAINKIKENGYYMAWVIYTVTDTAETISIAVFNAYDIKEGLKADGYKWERDIKAWCLDVSDLGKGADLVSKLEKIGYSFEYLLHDHRSK